MCGFALRALQLQGKVSCRELYCADYACRTGRGGQETFNDCGEITLQNYQNILVINMMHIGDLMLVTPVLRTLRTNYPQARITMLTDKIGRASCRERV